jgi:hypothetical protein
MSQPTRHLYEENPHHDLVDSLAYIESNVQQGSQEEKKIQALIAEELKIKEQEDTERKAKQAQLRKEAGSFDDFEEGKQDEDPDEPRRVPELESDITQLDPMLQAELERIGQGKPAEKLQLDRRYNVRRV